MSNSNANQLLQGLKDGKGSMSTRHKSQFKDQGEGGLKDPATLLPENTSEPVGPVSEAVNDTSISTPTDPMLDKVDWKKRYDDSRTFINKLQEEKKALEGKLTTTEQSIPLPESEEEVDAWKESNPELYAKMLTIIDKEVKPLKEILTKKEQEELNVKLFKEVERAHNDADEIRNSPLWVEWFSEQTPAIRSLVESSDARDIIRSITLFKNDVNWKQAPSQVQSNGKSADDASAVMVKGQSFTPVTQKKIWTDSEVRGMSQATYAKHREDIQLARKEGRYQFGM